MGQQRTFASVAWNQKGKVTRREQFLAEMDAVIPWAALVSLIEPHYPKAGRGRQPLGLEKMLRIHFLQQWFNLSDPQAEDAIYDSESMRRFARVELGDAAPPYLWSDALLHAWLAEAIGDFARLFPREETLALASVAGQVTYDLPLGLVEVVRVEHPAGRFRVHAPRRGGDAKAGFR